MEPLHRADAWDDATATLPRHPLLRSLARDVRELQLRLPGHADEHHGDDARPVRVGRQGRGRSPAPAAGGTLLGDPAEVAQPGRDLGGRAAGQAQPPGQLDPGQPRLAADLGERLGGRPPAVGLGPTGT